MMMLFLMLAVSALAETQCLKWEEKIQIKCYTLGRINCGDRECTNEEFTDQMIGYLKRDIKEPKNDDELIKRAVTESMFERHCDATKAKSCVTEVKTQDL